MQCYANFQFVYYYTAFPISTRQTRLPDIRAWESLTMNFVQYRLSYILENRWHASYNVHVYVICESVSVYYPTLAEPLNCC